MAQLSMDRPFDEARLHDDFRPDPVRAEPWQSLALRERGRWHLEGVELRPKLAQQRRIETGAQLSREHEIVTVEVADEQRTETDARSLRIGEPAHDQLLGRLALHLEPVRRAAVLVPGVAPLGDHALPAFAACALPRPVVFEQRDTAQWTLQRQLAQELTTGVEREPGDVTAVEPHDVEHVIGDFS